MTSRTGVNGAQRVSQLVSKHSQPPTSQDFAWPLRLTQQDVSHNGNRAVAIQPVQLKQRPAMLPLQLQAHRMNVSSMVMAVLDVGQVPAGGGSKQSSKQAQWWILRAVRLTVATPPSSGSWYQ